ncbi:MAG: hypothetical protein M3548_02070, partial [Actinomycetota bacterium]|nr:hypothetical protein [Actinomycetota bacterium]
MTSPPNKDTGVVSDKPVRRRLVLAAAIAAASGLGWAHSVAGRYTPPERLPPAGALRAEPFDGTVAGYRVRIGMGRWQIVDSAGRAVWDVPHAPVTAVAGSVRWHERIGHLTFQQ